MIRFHATWRGGPSLSGKEKLDVAPISRIRDAASGLERLYCRFFRTSATKGSSVDWPRMLMNVR